MSVILVIQHVTLSKDVIDIDNSDSRSGVTTDIVFA